MWFKYFKKYKNIGILKFIIFMKDDWKYFPLTTLESLDSSMQCILCILSEVQSKKVYRKHKLLFKINFDIFLTINTILNYSTYLFI